MPKFLRFGAPHNLVVLLTTQRYPNAWCLGGMARPYPEKPLKLYAFKKTVSQPTKVQGYQYGFGFNGVAIQRVRAKNRITLARWYHNNLALWLAEPVFDGEYWDAVAKIELSTTEFKELPVLTLD